MPKETLQNKQYFFNAGLITVIIGMYLLFAYLTYHSLQKYSEFVAVDAARRSADQLLATRSVMANLAPHITLDDAIDPFAATPAAVGNAIGEKLESQHHYYIKQTSLNYRNADNRPDDFEREMLNAFTPAEEERWVHLHVEGEDMLRYGKILRIEKACLRCHGTPHRDIPTPLYEKLLEHYGENAFNYKVGDVRGMISVMIPMSPFHEKAKAIFNQIFVIGFITLLLVLFLLYLHNRHIIQPYIRLLRESREKLLYTVNRDQMTGMLNRRSFNQIIRDNIATRKRPFWLFFIDLDNFKTVNDVYGHEAGDTVLISVSQRIKEKYPACDLFRMGGDEFVMMVYDIDDAGAIAELLKEIITEIRQPIAVHEGNAYVGASIGAAHYPTHATEIEPLLRHGDLAMYSAKQAGKNQFVLYDATLLSAANAVKMMESELKSALINEEFVLLYQPQHDIESNRIVGVEALLRWQHPKRGLLAPDAFIAVAEESGLIIDIGRWILYEACRQNKAWQDMGFEPINVAVNVTSAQLEDLGFIMDLVDVINETGLDPQYLELEFIERAAINNEGNTIEFMNQLRLMRIKAAIDDFGTGYSSLSYISKFPIDKIKIDRMFIDGIDYKDDNATIVRSMIAIAEHLNIEILAEGVETEDELQFLADEGCRLIQGFYFSKPLDAQALQSRLR